MDSIFDNKPHIVVTKRSGNHGIGIPQTQKISKDEFVSHLLQYFPEPWFRDLGSKIFSRSFPLNWAHQSREDLREVWKKFKSLREDDEERLFEVQLPTRQRAIMHAFGTVDVTGGGVRQGENVVKSKEKNVSFNTNDFVPTQIGQHSRLLRVNEEFNWLDVFRELERNKLLQSGDTSPYHYHYNNSFTETRPEFTMWAPQSPEGRSDSDKYRDLNELVDENGNPIRMIGNNEVNQLIVNMQVALIDPASRLTEADYFDSVQRGRVLIKKYGLSLGSSLPVELVDTLKEDVIIFVFVEYNGRKFMAPKLHLSQANRADTLRRNRSDSIIYAGGDILIDAGDEGVTSNGGLLEGANIDLKSKGDVELSGDGAFHSKGRVKIQTDEEFNMTGGHLEGKSVEINASKRIDINGATKYDRYGNLVVKNGSGITAEKLYIESKATISLKGAEVSAEEVKFKAKNMKQSGLSEVYSHNSHSPLGKKEEALQWSRFRPTLIRAKKLTYDIERDFEDEGSNISSDETEINIGGALKLNPGKSVYKSIRNEENFEREEIGKVYQNSDLQLGNASIKVQGPSDFAGADINTRCTDDSGCSLNIAVKKGSITTTIFENVTKVSGSYKGKSRSGFSLNHRGRIMAIANRLYELGIQEASLSPYHSLEMSGDLTQLAFGDLIEKSINFHSSSESSGTFSSTTIAENTSRIGGDVSLIASDGSIDMYGVDIGNENSNIKFKASGHVRLHGTTTRHTSEEENSSSHLNFEASIGAGMSGLGVGADVTYGESNDAASRRTVKHRMVKLRAKKLTIETGGDLEMDHASADTAERQLKIGGNVDIITRQDTIDSENSSNSWNFSLGVSDSTVTGGIPIPILSGGGENYDGFEKSSLTRGRAGFMSEMANDSIKGELRSTAGIMQADRGHLSVGGKIINKSLKDTIRKGGSGYGGNGGISNIGIPFASVNVRIAEKRDLDENVLPVLNYGLMRDSITTGEGIEGDHRETLENARETVRDGREANVLAEFELTPPQRLQQAVKNMAPLLKKIRRLDDGRIGILLSPDSPPRPPQGSSEYGGQDVSQDAQNTPGVTSQPGAGARGDSEQTKSVKRGKPASEDDDVSGYKEDDQRDFNPPESPKDVVESDAGHPNSGHPDDDAAPGSSEPATLPPEKRAEPGNQPRPSTSYKEGDQQGLSPQNPAKAKDTGESDRHDPTPGGSDDDAVPGSSEPATLPPEKRAEPGNQPRSTPPIKRMTGEILTLQSHLKM